MVEVRSESDFLYGLVLIAIFVIMMRFMYKTGMRELRALVMASRKGEDSEWTTDSVKG